MKINIVHENESTKGGWFRRPNSRHVFDIEIRMTDDEVARLSKIISADGSVIWFQYDRDAESRAGLHSGDPRKQAIARRVLELQRAKGRIFGETTADLLATIRKKAVYRKKFIYPTASERDSAVERCKQSLAIVKDSIEKFVDRTGQTEAFEL